MGKLKKLRKRSEELAYRVQILEHEQRIAELQQQRQQSPVGFQKRSIKTKKVGT